ncbi:type VII secretion-associated protein [Mycobacterium sp. CVI_P3]|uniref:Type VII secretion-associated protein n=1 Tax=Mycobacterium pinniadriaticum TaxID=2994102 RepID=A0ABT3SDV6_9MYCO|nr:type VII secretion-associated protein [Mycobacterium pinniadriaticum]MCX2931080.1 type VII secretion-associated protein [Mycobacterium pinniadriaticum]MCX2937696.1 type VII secretion-associated protein [Mycobacterium pinniadriaticum]
MCKTSNSAEMVAVALAGIDDTTVLYRERPIAVSDLLRQIIGAHVETGCESLTIVHPSWWPRHRVARVVDAATAVAADVRTLPRFAVFAAGDSTTMVEIADDVVAISSRDEPPRIIARPQDPGDVARTLETAYGTRVVIDAPPGVTGAPEYARALRATLTRVGVAVELARTPDLPPPPASAAKPVSPSTRPRHWRGSALVAVSVALTLCAIGLNAARPHAAAPTLDAVNLVEGRVTLLIPAEWAVTRITAGPGSRRIQATSPIEPNVALHMTQTYSPGETLERTGATLRRAVADQPGGVFVEFNPSDRRGGRPAVTYREIRVGRDIRWVVVLDGSTRISVGCQSASGREEMVAEPCEKAVESAREVTGTVGGV